MAGLPENVVFFSGGTYLHLSGVGVFSAPWCGECAERSSSTRANRVGTAFPDTGRTTHTESGSNE